MSWNKFPTFLDWLVWDVQGHLSKKNRDNMQEVFSRIALDSGLSIELRMLGLLTGMLYPPVYNKRSVAFHLTAKCLSERLDVSDEELGALFSLLEDGAIVYMDGTKSGVTVSVETHPRQLLGIFVFNKPCSHDFGKAPFGPRALIIVEDPEQLTETIYVDQERDQKIIDHLVILAAWNIAHRDDADAVPLEPRESLPPLTGSKVDRKLQARRRSIFRLVRRMPAPKQGPTEKRETGTGHKLTFQVAVQGHWRNQPCGPGRTQTRRIWISDHKRRPDLPVRADIHDVLRT